MKRQRLGQVRRARRRASCPSSPSRPRSRQAGAPVAATKSASDAKARLAITSNRSSRSSRRGRERAPDVAEAQSAGRLGDERRLLADAVDAGDFSFRQRDRDDHARQARAAADIEQALAASSGRRGDRSAAAAARQSSDVLDRPCRAGRGSRSGCRSRSSARSAARSRPSGRPSRRRDRQVQCAAPSDDRVGELDVVGRAGETVAALKRRRWRRASVRPATCARRCFLTCTSKQRHRRGRHPRQPRRGAERRRALRVERLAHFERQRANRGEVEVAVESASIRSARHARPLRLCFSM